MSVHSTPRTEILIAKPPSRQETRAALEARPSSRVQSKDGGTPVAKCEKFHPTSEMTNATIVDKTCISVPGWKADPRRPCCESPVLRARVGQWSDVWQFAELSSGTERRLVHLYTARMAGCETESDSRTAMSPEQLLEPSSPEEEACSAKGVTRDRKSVV